MEENMFLYEKIEDSKHLSLTRSIRLVLIQSVGKRSVHSSPK